MELVTSVKQMQEIALRLRRGGRRIGLVPTMGSLHDGHMSLVREVKKRCAANVLSIFVNPTQFAPGEDFEKYPRDLERDKSLCAREGVHYIFAPSTDEIYPKDFSTYVVEEAIASHLEGARRPTHFRGVCTIVAKLFHIVLPDVAVFGQKDAQQSLVIKRMVRDMNFPTEIIVAPIARDTDGLAMSSRNSYLSPVERKQARVLHSALEWALNEWRKGVKEAADLRRGMTKIMLFAPEVKVDYVEFANAETFHLVHKVEKGTYILVAASVGKTHLIDNVLVE